MDISAIEIGTNSTKFIIAEVNDNGTFKTISKASMVNRLSSGMYLRNEITPEAIKRTEEILGEYIEQSKNRGAKLVSIFSTSVLRDANNKEDILKSIREKYGIDINIISGEHEAYLAHMACSRLIQKDGVRFAVIDIGGGSTEIIIGNNKNIEQKVSLNIGAVRLTEMFIKHDPSTPKEVAEISEYVENELEKIGLLNIDGIEFLGTGGTIKSIGTIFNKDDYKDETTINGIVLSRDDISVMYDFLAKCSMENKKNIVGLNPKRADVILAGVLILLTVMKKYRVKEIKVSTQGVIEGFIQDYLQTQTN